MCTPKTENAISGEVLVICTEGDEHASLCMYVVVEAGVGGCLVGRKGGCGPQYCAIFDRLKA